MKTLPVLARQVTPSLLFLAVAALTASCAHDPAPDAYGRIAPPRGYRLVTAVADRTSNSLGLARDELELDLLKEEERRPRLVAQGRTPIVSLEEGERARLYGDLRGTVGWSVDTCVLLEVFTRAGLYSSAVAGHAPGLLLAKQRVDNIGRHSATFEAGELDLNAKLPPDEPFYIQATVLGTGEVAKVSDLYLVFEKRWQPPSPKDMREQ